MLQTGRRTNVYFAVLATLLVAFFLSTWTRLSGSYGQLRPDLASLGDYWPFGNGAGASPYRRTHCFDPYRRPGFLHINKADYAETRWVPYTSDFIEHDAPHGASYPYDLAHDGELWLDADKPPADKWLNHALAPADWMMGAVAESWHTLHNEDKDKPFRGRMSWMRGRVVLLVSDSIDRYMTQFFCEEMNVRAGDKGAKLKNGPRAHSWAECVVPSLNFTIVHWHMPGMLPYTPDWWYDRVNIPVVPFEERWGNPWNSTLDDITSISGHGPDLIIWQSGLWDRKSMPFMVKAHYGDETPLAAWTRPLFFEEVRFYAARAKQLVRFLKRKFGADVPMMLRTTTVDRKSMAKDVQTLAMDNAARAVAEHHGVEPFEWGKLVVGHPELYRDDMHLGQGPASWLWANMLLEYLARAVGAGSKGGGSKARAPYFDGWDKCARQLVAI